MSMFASLQLDRLTNQLVASIVDSLTSPRPGTLFRISASALVAAAAAAKTLKMSLAMGLLGICICSSGRRVAWQSTQQLFYSESKNKLAQLAAIPGSLFQSLSLSSLLLLLTRL